tara:strand:- start:540 stop:1016 length:477 start_codon:yes stop_codon:yes gene_type:complete
MIKIKDNFLDPFVFFNIKKEIMGKYFPWFYNDCKVETGDDYFQFIHFFYKENVITSNYFDLIKPVLEKLKVKSLIRIKGNLTTKNTTIKPFGHHVDIPFKCKTAILYINNNNGITVFERGKKIESRENRMITFSSNLKHTGTTHTDEKVRIVLNINYF